MLYDFNVETNLHIHKIMVNGSELTKKLLTNKYLD